MYRNLEAEQARYAMTDEAVATQLSILRPTYVSKKKNGSFKVRECYILCMLFECDFEYLFATDSSTYKTV